MNTSYFRRIYSYGIVNFCISKVQISLNLFFSDVSYISFAFFPIVVSFRLKLVIDPIDEPMHLLILPYHFLSVVSAIQSGNTYVVVHTKEHPKGELRGQILQGNED